VEFKKMFCEWGNEGFCAWKFYPVGGEILNTGENQKLFYLLLHIYLAKAGCLFFSIHRLKPVD
jgi:hypothetical protein